MCRSFAILLLTAFALPAWAEGAPPGGRVQIHLQRVFGFDDVEVGVRSGAKLRPCLDHFSPRQHGFCELRDVPAGDAVVVVWPVGDPSQPLFEQKVAVPEDGLAIKLVERSKVVPIGFVASGILTAGITISTATGGPVRFAPPPSTAGLVGFGAASAAEIGAGFWFAALERFKLETFLLPPPLDSPKRLHGKALVVRARVSGTDELEVSVETPNGRESCGPKVRFEKDCTLYGLAPGPATLRLKLADRIIEKQIVLSSEREVLRLQYDPAPVRNGLILTSVGTAVGALGWYAFEHPDKDKPLSKPGAAFIVGLGAFAAGGGVYTLIRGLVSPAPLDIELRSVEEEERSPFARPVPIAFEGTSVAPSLDGSGATIAAAWSF